jgi:ElaB/YqjD/DUF883 family membrane-anchored ribosome-binding protein
MATTKPHQNATDQSMRSNQQAESPKEITHDIIEYVSEYVRENPVHAAVACLGVGFVLGWKLKPW